MSMIANFRAATDLEIARLMREPEGITDFIEREGARELDADKAWHAIHFLLAGQPWEGELPLGFIMAGRQIGDVDVGYGPASALTSVEVRSVAAALAPITREDLMSRWNRDAMREAEIYAVDPDKPDDEDEYVGVHYQALKEFVAGLATEGLGLIVYFS